MATVAIVHAAEDALPARALAEKLRAARVNVVLEKHGEDLRDALRDAKVTIALWSPRSVAQPALIEDAAFARSKSAVIHATMQNAALPQDFSGDKAVNLTGWRGEDDFAAWRELANLVMQKAGAGPLPPPTPRPPSGFFQPGVVRDPHGAGAAPAAAPRPAQAAPRPAPPPRPQPAPRPQPEPRAYAPQAPESGGGGNGMLMGAIVFVVVALAGGGGYYLWSQQQSQASTTAWDSVAQNDPDALRAFLSADPGEYRDEAQAALAQLEERTYEAASDADTIEALEAFLNDFPESEHAIAARGRIAELRTMQPTEEAPAEGELPPLEPLPSTDPDLVPPGTAQAPGPSPDTSGGPPSIAPPPTEETPPATEPAPPTN